jgi:hypothetical protein
MFLYCCRLSCRGYGCVYSYVIKSYINQGGQQMQQWVLEKIAYLPKRVQRSFRTRLRERALLRTRARLVESAVDIEKLSDEELEIIIRDEEDKLLGEYKSKGLIALLALLGISWF